MIVPRTKPITQKRLEQILKGRNDQKYRNWKDAVLARDGFVCQFPNCQEKQKLEVHHIKRWTDSAHLRHEIFNGITLCKKHHASIQGQEKFWEIPFFEIVKANAANNKKI